MALQHYINIEEQIATAIDREVKKPHVLRGLLDEMSLPPSFVARCIGVALPTLSNWSAGRTQLSDIHKQRLVALLRAAIQIGGNTAVPGAYAQRIEAARNTLGEIDEIA